MLASHDWYPCAPWKDRPDFQGPDGKRLAVYLAVNVEHCPYGEPRGIDLDRPTLSWSQRSWLWRDYGNRVGGWKLLDLFEDLRFPGLRGLAMSDTPHTPSHWLSLHRS